MFIKQSKFQKERGKALLNKQEFRYTKSLNFAVLMLFILFSSPSCITQPSYDQIKADMEVLKDLKENNGNGPNILLAWDNPHNQKHPYYKVFKENERIGQENGYQYSPTLYKFNQLYQEKPAASKSQRLIVDQGGENSLIFILDYGSHKSLDTLQNFIHPGPGDVGYDAVYGIESAEETNTDFAGGPSGKLPPGTRINIASPIGDKLQVRLKLAEAASNANIKVIALNGQVVKQLVNNALSAGTHSFSWKVKEQKGTYLLQVEIDGQTLNQMIGDNAYISWQ